MELKDTYDVKSLASVLGCDTKALVYYVYRRKQAAQYQTFEIPKRSGGTRTINAPISNLCLIQSRIATALETQRYFKSCVNGFVKGRDIKRNASFHVGRKFVFNIDLKDFFPSITFPRIYGMLINRPYLLDPKVAACIAKACTLDGILPQGAPSSPIISNLICAKLDSQLASLAHKYKCRYSRYADDITFSFVREPPEAIAVPEYDETGELLFIDVGQVLAAIIHQNGFEINEKKVRLISRNGRQEVTGLVVNEKVNVKRRFVRQVRAMLHAWEKFGYLDAQDKYWEEYSPGEKKSSFEEVVRGKITFIRHVKGASDPVFQKLAIGFNRLCAGKPIPLELKPSEVADRATWILEAPMMQSTAFLLEGVGFVTCAHCVTEDTKIIGGLEVWHPDNPSVKFPVAVLRADTDRDLAVVSVPKELADIIRLSVSSADPGLPDLKVRLLGYPNHKLGSPIRKETGQVLRTIVRSTVKYIEVTMKIIEGNSGGPVLDEDFKVLGVAKTGLTEKTDIAGAEFLAISITEL